MLAAIGLEVDVEDEAALKRKMEAAIEAVEAVSASCALHEYPFTLVGTTRGAPEKQWLEHVHAADKDGARALGNDERVVVAVLDGHVEPMLGVSRMSEINARPAPTRD